ncbi:MAG: DNA gyrase inhibitor YacG [Phycisphaerales bacterium]
MKREESTTKKQLATEPCRTCGKPVTESTKAYPFCSDRCRMGDLGKWFSGEYTISRPLEQRDIEDGD